VNISSETVINKMMEELEKAKGSVHHSRLIDHISKVKLLSELLLEEYHQEKKIPQEIEHLQTKLLNEEKTFKEISPKQQLIDVDDHDGTSIFDF